ncbi:MAG: hypothetical protein LBO62_07325, partial [Endomicrobium sp.]|nr:hypothetical protein [Endomicrobium sp.]
IDTAYKGKQNERLLKLNKMISGIVTLYTDISRGFIAKGQSYSLGLLEKIVDKETYGRVAAQIFENAYMNARRKYSAAVLERFLNAEQKKEYYAFLNTKADLNKGLLHIIKEKLP